MMTRTIATFRRHLKIPTRARKSWRKQYMLGQLSMDMSSSREIVGKTLWVSCISVTSIVVNMARCAREDETGRASDPTGRVAGRAVRCRLLPSHSIPTSRRATGKFAIASLSIIIRLNQQSSSQVTDGVLGLETSRRPSMTFLRFRLPIARFSLSYKGHIPTVFSTFMMWRT
jgi:hypothetical protein